MEKNKNEKQHNNSNNNYKEKKEERISWTRHAMSSEERIEEYNVVRPIDAGKAIGSIYWLWPRFAGVMMSASVDSECIFLAFSYRDACARIHRPATCTHLM